VRPTLLVGLFKAPEELSAAVALELLYFYALAHQAPGPPSPLPPTVWGRPGQPPPPSPLPPPWTPLWVAREGPGGDSFDVRWLRTGSVAETLIHPLATGRPPG